jgi:hypothetical protein
MNNFLRKEDLFIKLTFNKQQRNAIQDIFKKYFEQLAKDYEYIGFAIPLRWDQHLDGGPLIRTFDGTNTNIKVDRMVGYSLNDLKLDPLWDAFSDILPYMGQHGSLTFMPPMTVMLPHIDRASRPHAIYFTITDPDWHCISDYYQMPRNDPGRLQQVTTEVPVPLYSYRMMNDVYLMNTQEWHGVRNYSKKTRITFGWNCSRDNQKTFPELVEIFSKLGYVSTTQKF